jgi:hypothetical protein
MCTSVQSIKCGGKNFVWKNKPFITDSMRTFFHIPSLSSINKKMTSLYNSAKNSKKISKKTDEVLILFRDPSAFRSEIYFSVTGKVKEAKNVNLSGTFVAKVFDGPYKAVPKFIKEMNEYLAKKGKKAKDYYIHYAYCPKCAKKYGNNFMIIFAKI